MSHSRPIPAPPRTPSPLSEDDVDTFDSAYLAPLSARNISFDPNVLSPTSDAFDRRRNSLVPTPTSATSFYSMSDTLSPVSAEGPTHSHDEGLRNPFNYQTTTYSLGKPTPNKSNVGQRRGHKYKHSSVSHQIFLEPAPKAPLRLPASLPIPTIREGWKSMSKEQRVRFWWCFCHLSVAGYVQWNAEESLSLTALSHLIIYDAIGAFLCTGIEVLSNFEVWKRSSIRQPFGLERSEVLVGFAMSILLLFMGFDLLSHNISHSLEKVGDHEPHVAHSHEIRPITARSMVPISLLAMFSTLVSAVMLKNHARIAKAMRLRSLSFLPTILSNPTHLLTLSCSAVQLLTPLLSVDRFRLFDQVLSTAMALLMTVLGYQLVKTLGSILLMSCTSDGSIADVLREIEGDPAVKTIDEAKFWQVHYGLSMANLKLTVCGTEDVLAKVRERAVVLIENRLGGADGVEAKPGSTHHWEISMQLNLEKD